MNKTTDKHMLQSPKKAQKADSAIENKGRFAYEGLQRIFHEKARLGIMTSLLTYPKGLTFNDLKELCSLSDGNLNRHIEALRDEGFVVVNKSGAGRASKTLCISTDLGHSSFHEYLQELQRVLLDAELSRQALKVSSINSSSVLKVT